jgi:proteic killer suppression protein
VIRSFKYKETEKIFSRRRSRKLPHDIQQVALCKLRMPNRAVTLNDLRVPPANRLEQLKGDRAGQHSIRINEIVLGKRRVTADTALRLGRYFDMSPQFWLGLQMDYDLDITADKMGGRLDREVRPYALAPTS